ncbi:MAG: ABC transporter permease [Actinobacteria bacterium]|nr:ABC transporter permease [Actinomycetota bacterium]
MSTDERVLATTTSELPRLGSGGPPPAKRVPFRALRDKLVDLWLARELLRQLVGKELKVRYKNSALGFLWSLLTPALMTVVFTVIFQYVIRIQVLDFAAFFLSGYLVWQFFQNSAQGSVGAIVGNGALIKKVYFPREVLPLSIVLSQVVHLVLALVAVSPYLIWSRGWSIVLHLPAILIGILLVTVFTAGVSMLLAGANVPFRDLQELIVVIFMVWFYATPIIYPIAMVTGSDTAAGAVFGHILNANPMTWFVKLFRESIYGSVVSNPRCAEFATVNPSDPCPYRPFLTEPQSWPSPELLLGCTLAAGIAFALGYLAFHRFAVNFAKEV